MRVCYLDWTMLLPSESHRKPINLLQPFYFHMWPIYWLSLSRIWQLNWGRASNNLVLVEDGEGVQEE
jgi:hypothetical protein